MSELNVKLTGWTAVLGVLVLAGVVVFRIVTFNDQTNDEDLMRSLETELMSDYYPDEVARLSAAMDEGDRENLSRVAESVTSAKANIESVQTSAPLFSFSSRKEVVVKVVYSLKDSVGKRDRKTKYYLYRHGAIGNSWQYKYETSIVRYYLNLI